MSTQIFLNPADSPTDAVVSFKVNPTLLADTVAAGTSNLAIGFATDAELNTLSSWTESQISASSGNRFAVGFGRSTTAPAKVGVNIQGTQYTTIARAQNVSSVDITGNTLAMNDHPFVTGDRIIVSSTGSLPGGLATDTAYYAINSSTNSIKVAVSYADAIAGTEIDIQAAGSGTITVASDEIFTLTRSGATGAVSLRKGANTIAVFTNTNQQSPLRLFYWCREQSASSTAPLVKEVKVRGAT
jgi:hypothetical protein